MHEIDFFSAGNNKTPRHLTIKLLLMISQNTRVFDCFLMVNSKPTESVKGTSARFSLTIKLLLLIQFSVRFCLGGTPKSFSTSAPQQYNYGLHPIYT